MSQSNTRIPTSENWKESAIDISQADVSGQMDVVRHERSALFNARTSDVQKLDSSDPNRKNSETTIVDFVRTPPIPAQESDAIIVGTASSVQPYFSTDHTHIYTEFTVDVEQLLKDVTKRAQTGGTIPIVLLGGTIRLKDGRIVKDKLAKTNFTIATGGRYVFFLHYVPQGQHFTVTKSWELKNGAAIPTAREDRLDSQQGQSRFSGTPEQGFIQTVKQAASTGQDHQ